MNRKKSKPFVPFNLSAKIRVTLASLPNNEVGTHVLVPAEQYGCTLACENKRARLFDVLTGTGKQFIIECGLAPSLKRVVQAPSRSIKPL